jgi:DNA replication licensing factor MCM4
LFNDKQLVKIQEMPENIPEGETPLTIIAYTYDNLCDVLVPGDRVTLTGIFRALPQRLNPRIRTVKSVFKTHLDVLHIEKYNPTRMNAEEATPVAAGGLREGAGGISRQLSIGGLSALQLERQARIEAMAREPNLYSRLAHSLAPSIWEMEDVKKGLLLQLFGGCNKETTRIRGEINILLCGDPGISKSQLLSYVHKTAARGIYTSGKGSSAVGLTASLVKDPDTREPMLESGALVLSDRGVCCIDEFDKMNDSTRSILHEVMEQQTVSIAKAGVIATLNARTSILASANPIESRYNPKLSIIDNLQLPSSLLSRFDLIYVLLDPERPENDRRLATHLVSLFQDPAERVQSSNNFFPKKALTDYISYAKAKVHPRLTDEASRALIAAYIELRQLGARSSGKKIITATTRQLESFIRLSEAHARLHLRSEVTQEDVEEAVRLVRVATQQAATDPRTGMINMDLLTTGHTDAQRDHVQNLVEVLRDLMVDRPHKSSYSVNSLIRDLSTDTDIPIVREEVAEALRTLASESNPIILYQRGNVIRL